VDFVASGPSDVVMAQGRGQNVVALTSGYRGFAASIVISKVAADKAGVSGTSPISARLKALDGLTIASTSAGSTFTVGLKTAAESAGAKVNVVYMAQPAMVAAFQRGIIDGFTVSAPYYVVPVTNGSGVMWVSGPKGEFPKMSAPANSSVLMAKREFAEANPDLIKRVTAVFSDFWKAIDERPADVKAAIAKLWPDLDAKTIDIVFEAEAPGFKAKPLTIDDMQHEIDFMKLGKIELPHGDRLNPAAMLFP
jgi:ABC-type nitrate/sulfonate/bicarbonate transport system substrate-binding protein